MAESKIGPKLAALQALGERKRLERSAAAPKTIKQEIIAQYRKDAKAGLVVPLGELRKKDKKAKKKKAKRG
ncbi:MAG: hypothetical protein V4773_16610 [Verrucomicrobiota bacterium]